MHKLFITVVSIALSVMLILPHDVYARDPDINDDGVVNILDISIAGGCLFREVSEEDEVCLKADTDENAFVDIEDLNFIVSHFGKTGFPFYTPPDLSAIVIDPTGGHYPANQINVMVFKGTQRDYVDELAESVGGTVIGFFPLIGSYQFEIPATTVEEFRAIEAILEKDSAVEFATPNALFQFH